VPALNVVQPHAGHRCKAPFWRTIRLGALDSR
jgi:hypothetical protein